MNQKDSQLTLQIYQVAKIAQLDPFYSIDMTRVQALVKL